MPIVGQTAADAGANPIVCLRCGYDLRGVEAVCPECGLGVAVSAGQRERLADCPPAWVRRVAAGVGVLGLSVVLMLPAGLVTIEEAMPIRTWKVVEAISTWMWQGAGGWQVGVATVFGVGPLSHLVGVWLVTGREPGIAKVGTGWGWAWRVITAIWLAAVFTAVYTPRWVATPGAVWPYFFWKFLPTCVAAVALVIVPAVGMWHVRALAVRVGRARVAEHAGIVGVGMSTVMAVLTLRNAPASLDAFKWYLEGGSYGSAFRGWEHTGPLVVVVPPALALAAYALRRWEGRGGARSGRYVAVAAGLYVLAAGWAMVLKDGGYTRRFWATLVASGLLVTMATLLYGWTILVLLRTSRGLWEAAREAREAWRKADAAASP